MRNKATIDTWGFTIESGGSHRIRMNFIESHFFWNFDRVLFVSVWVTLCYFWIALYLCVCVAQSCLTLWGTMVCSPPGSSVHGTSKARILEWVTISFSRGSSWPRDQTWSSALQILHHLSHQGSPSVSLNCLPCLCSQTRCWAKILTSLMCEEINTPSFTSLHLLEINICG